MGIPTDNRPPRPPRDVRDRMKAAMEPIIPWYKGFTGRVEPAKGAKDG